MGDIIRLADRRNPSKNDKSRFTVSDFLREEIKALEKAGYDVLFEKPQVNMVLIRPVNTNRLFSH